MSEYCFVVLQSELDEVELVGTDRIFIIFTW